MKAKRRVVTAADRVPVRPRRPEPARRTASTVATPSSVTPVSPGGRPAPASRNGPSSAIGGAAEIAGLDARAAAIDLSVDLAYVLNGIADSGTVPGTRAGDSKLMFTLFYRF